MDESEFEIEEPTTEWDVVTEPDLRTVFFDDLEYAELGGEAGE